MGVLRLVSIISTSSKLEIMHRFFCWIPYSLKNSLTKFENFLSTESTDWELALPVQQILVETGSNSEHLSLFWSYIPHSDSKSCSVFFVGLLILQGTFFKFSNLFSIESTSWELSAGSSGQLALSTVFIVFGVQILLGSGL